MTEDNNVQSGTQPPSDRSEMPGARPSSETSEHAHRPKSDRPYKKRFDRDRRSPRHQGRPMDRGRQSRRPGRYRPTAEGGVQRAEEDDRLKEIIRNTELTLAEAIQPVQLPNLNAFERKQIHQYFERRKPAFETKTYRGEGDSQVLWVFPIANLTKFAEAKAQEALETGKDIVLPPMSSYERFIVHNVLKDMESVEAVSVGDGPERHIVIQSKQFGRGLKKIMKKIKLL